MNHLKISIILLVFILLLSFLSFFVSTVIEQLDNSIIDVQKIAKLNHILIGLNIDNSDSVIDQIMALQLNNPFFTYIINDQILNNLGKCTYIKEITDYIISNTKTNSDKMKNTLKQAVLSNTQDDIKDCLTIELASLINDILEGTTPESAENDINTVSDVISDKNLDGKLIQGPLIMSIINIFELSDYNKVIIIRKIVDSTINTYNVSSDQMKKTWDQNNCDAPTTMTPYDPTTMPYVAATTPYVPTTTPYVPTTTPYVPTTRPYMPTTTPYVPTTTPYVPTTTPYVPTTTPYVPTTRPYVPTTTPYVPTTTPYVPTTTPYVSTPPPYVSGFRLSGLKYNEGTDIKFPAIAGTSVLYITEGENGTLTIGPNFKMKRIFLVGGGAGGTSSGYPYNLPGLGGTVIDIDTTSIPNIVPNQNVNYTFTITVGNGGSPGYSGKDSSIYSSTINEISSLIAKGGRVANDSNNFIIKGTQFTKNKNGINGNSFYYGGSGGGGETPNQGNEKINAPLGGGGGGGGVGYFAEHNNETKGTHGGKGGGISDSLSGGEGGVEGDGKKGSNGDGGVSSDYGGGGGGGGGGSSNASKNLYSYTSGGSGGGGGGSSGSGGSGGSGSEGTGSYKGGGGGGGNGGVNTGGGGGAGGAGDVNLGAQNGKGGSGGSGIVIILYSIVN